MATKLSKIYVSWAERYQYRKGRPEFRLSLMLIPVTLNGTNGGEIFGMYASVRIAISVIKMEKHEVHGIVLEL